MCEPSWPYIFLLLYWLAHSLLLNGISDLSTPLEVLSVVVVGRTQMDAIVQFRHLQRLHTDTHTHASLEHPGMHADHLVWLSLNA